MDKRTVIVTGSSTGIGFAIAELFYKQGYNVVMTSMNEERLQNAYDQIGPSDRIFKVAGDIGNRDFNIKLIDLAIEKFGSVDILINSAGSFMPKPFVDVSEADFDNYLNINLKGTFFTSQAAIKVMIKQGGGSIINMGTSLVDHPIGGFPASAATTSKAGIQALTRQLAAEFGKNNIKVNTIVPGLIRTPLFTKIGVVVDTLVGMNLLNKIGEAKDIAPVALMIAENDFITGATIYADGGQVSGHHFN